MKKKYLKPNAEYINLVSTEAIANIVDGDMSIGQMPDDWE